MPTNEIALAKHLSIGAETASGPGRRNVRQFWLLLEGKQAQSFRMGASKMMLKAMAMRKRLPRTARGFITPHCKTA
jgi:hypothetical protein